MATTSTNPTRWFEFILDPDSLEKQLETTPQLINLLLTETISNIDSDEIFIPPDSFEAKYRYKKSYAQLNLAIKIASFLKWNLDTICTDLSIPVQNKLMQALMKACEAENCPQEIQKFASTLYAQWHLRTAIAFRLSAFQTQNNNTTIIYLSPLQQQQQAAESSALAQLREYFSTNTKQLEEHSQGLQAYITEVAQKFAKDGGKRSAKDPHPFKKVHLKRPLVECFSVTSESLHDWNKSETIDAEKFLKWACYDLGKFYFYEESYESAKKAFELIRPSASDKFMYLSEYLQSATDILNHLAGNKSIANHHHVRPSSPKKQRQAHQQQAPECDDILAKLNEKNNKTREFVFNCMKQYSEDKRLDVDAMDIDPSSDERGKQFQNDSDLRCDPAGQANEQLKSAADNQVSWYLPMPLQQQHMLEATKGDMYMSQGNLKEAMGCFVGTIMISTDYFRLFSPSYVDEEPYITRMIQCSLSLGCHTQAVALCQMNKSINYALAFKHLAERVCNDCCDDIYECIWNVTLLEYIISLHTKRGEVERRARVSQLIGQLELNENNPDEILREAEHVRRGRFFRIMANKYL